MAILGNWVSMTGLRRTTPAFVHDLSVKVDAHAGIDRVEFAIVANGTPHSTLTASALSMRFPNFGSVSLKPFWGHGVGLDLSTVPAGTIVVTATVYQVGGGSYVLPDTMTIYNDTDGGDRRPRQVTIYADGTDGNDANNGSSWALAVKTIGRARVLARSGAGDLSGARIICRGTFTDVSGANYPECSTSGAWWCEHIADAAGAFFNTGESAGPRYISSGVGGTSSSTVICKNRWIGFRFGSVSLIAYTYGGIVWHWMDACTMQALDWVSGRLSVLYADPARGVQGYFFGWDGAPATPGARFLTSCSIKGTPLGYEPHRFLYDCTVDDFIGIAAKVGSAQTPSVTGAFLMRNERYAARTVHGFVRMDSDAVMGKGRVACTVTKPTGTTARITGLVGGYDFSIDADDLVGSTYWGLRFEGSGATGLDTGVGLLVTAVGNTGGAPWVEVTCPGASAGSWAANTCAFYTARVATGMNYWNIHPDGIQIERNLVLGDVIFDSRLVDAPDLQSYFTSGNDADQVLIDNVGDDGSGLNVMNFFGADVTNSILQRLTIIGQFQNTATASGWAGTYVRNCTFGSLGGEASLIPSRGGTVSNCHVISGGGFGTNATTGTWFANNPTVSPFSFEPTSGNKGTGTTAVVDPPAWAYSLSGSTRGVMRNVGELDWSVSATGLDATGQANVPVSASGASALLIVATGSSSVAPSASGASSLSIAAAGASAVGVGASGAAALQVGSDGAALVGVSASGVSTVGAVGIIATGSASVPVVASGASTLAAVPVIVPPPPQQAPKGISRPASQLRRSIWRWLSPWD